MYPVLYQWGDFGIYSYGVMLALAITLGIIGARRVFKLEGLAEEIIFDMAIIMVVSGLIGARLAYVLFYSWPEFSANPWYFFNLRAGGLVFYGGFLGGFLGFAGYVWKKRLSFWRMADIFAPYLALGYAVARVGCFLNGCCFGEPTHQSWGVVFPGVDEIVRHPTQIYSSLTSLFLFGLLYWLYPRRKFRGQVFLVYLMVYAVTRFIIEFWRENLVVWQGLTLAQVTALAVLVVAVPLYSVLRRRFSTNKTVTKYCG